MGRLDDIAERNKRENKRSTMRVATAIGIALLVVVTVVLAIYTNLGEPAKPDRSRAYDVKLRSH